ncbi:MAG: glyoxalase, partial [Actinomycetota bacterium]|nr:glyoxalase [Actinomycetota bacterium]
GIPQVEKPPQLKARGGCWFESALIRVHLGVEEGFRPAKKAHPALLVNGLSEMKQRLVQAGVEVVDDEALPGFERCYAHDPFGNRLELLEPLP